MSPLQRALIEKCGHDHGFEHVLGADAGGVTLASARHKARATVRLTQTGYRVHFSAPTPALQAELARCFATLMQPDAGFHAGSDAELATLLSRAAGLARALPNQAATGYAQAVAEELASLPSSIVGTEIERMVRQRVGQQRFREALLEYWGGACAVTGLALPDVLRASHAKPWAECASDAERLDVFNGFLLTANLDALFDRFMISFDEEGWLLVSGRLSEVDRQTLGLRPSLRLRWVASQHQGYLAYHRRQFRRLCMPGQRAQN